MKPLENRQFGFHVLGRGNLQILGMHFQISLTSEYVTKSGWVPFGDLRLQRLNKRINAWAVIQILIRTRFYYAASWHVKLNRKPASPDREQTAFAFNLRRKKWWVLFAAWKLIILLIEIDTACNFCKNGR